MIKLLGAALIVLSAGSVGIRMAQSVRAEDRELRQLKRVLELMLCEIQGSLTPAQELCERAQAICKGQLRQLLADYAAGLSAHRAAEAGQIMEAALVRQTRALPVSCICHLRELGEILGRYDCNEQTRAMQALIARVDDSIARLREGKADRCRSYEVLGVCAGCALAILLL